MNKRQKKKRAMSRLKVCRAIFGKQQTTMMRRWIRVGLKAMSNKNTAIYGRAYLGLIDEVLTSSMVSHSTIDIQEVLSKTDTAFNNVLLSSTVSSIYREAFNT